MAEKQINQKPYRQVLEALISHQTESKMSALLGSAAANLDDPWLRHNIKVLISKISTKYPRYSGAKRIFEMVPSLGQFPDQVDTEKFTYELIDYIESILDAEECAWELIARNNGWESPEDESE